MQLLSIDDPRNALEKATRKELELFARERGVTQIDPRMPAILMRKILRAAGQTDIASVFPQIRTRTAGQQMGVNAGKRGGPSISGSEIDAADLLAAEWQHEAKKQGLVQAPALATEPAPAPASHKPSNEMAELRAECKRRGIKAKRTDKLVDLRAKLDGENASQRGQ
jgi:hypothetical protein